MRFQQSEELGRSGTRRRSGTRQEFRQCRSGTRQEFRRWGPAESLGDFRYFLCG
ncbi:hypothetical protein RBSH_01849 [Rhodopirellula baltica SH28]|uniref:Uncharacterized protein n=1 Tax=Rhodopirellula baltica SH28 TaxID=993517 RepID=K5DK60_RHOBT|nr:hypothetical protein RBSH_01849 [Rhodopirellula baltica SH28]